MKYVVINRLKKHSDENGNCTQCGRCCSAFIPLTKQETLLMGSWFKKEDYEPLYFAGKYWLTCPYLKEIEVGHNEPRKFKCSMYHKKRPKICEAFKCGEELQLDRNKYIITDILWDACKFDYTHLAGITPKELRRKEEEFLSNELKMLRENDE